MKSDAGLRDHRRDWEDLAESDPLWAILSDPTKRHGRWDIDEFFATGAPEVAQVLARAEASGLPERSRSALDFGCGVGRVTRAMAAHFDKCIGVDVSAAMVKAANDLNATAQGIEFVLNDRADLAGFADGEFDLVYSTIVLQHLPKRALIERYVQEFVRVLADGGLLVFHLPSRIPPRRRLQPRRRAYAMLRRLGVSPMTLDVRFGLSPIRMNAVPSDRIRSLLEDAGAALLEVDQSVGSDGITNAVYWATKRELR